MIAIVLRQKRACPRFWVLLHQWHNEVKGFGDLYNTVKCSNVNKFSFGGSLCLVVSSHIYRNQKEPMHGSRSE